MCRAMYLESACMNARQSDERSHMLRCVWHAQKNPWCKINNIVFYLPFLFFLHSIGFYSLRDDL